ncbi:inhibitor of apoptosis-promoting Bax1 family protein [Ehrlichia chaffeensis str. Heartland]|uniref:Membrane protein n=1 Tax=Ehrlichia chaffeensis (strain ATCC CRL-10679 / Arkansas) TaxID=205920 RepID=Q2GI89_EHRCR|nr:Bax inhibitor-1/YccA family protein [Ehrlichia chaffeensis]ABD44746.1 putative membrane protein [Ehrlichia chaffeensis str. Arkansas]AHX03200.1 inhibitor of apoptosis-promoting Bax1 family protein [Ehrlichia chaffeensis str. Heartland]AHX05116.1 inhibitor of apoptosis-promoting Bax1 family protein [Ehrlichia chaffeensis str. Jax]AHX06105.1 inhibitor of apoptosis-promoting Bax1 family protein [Ehrlichia chaffeensis str. Liberty]AHX07236.1 inhibitor of apoptosis-promoting Bax1 family protein 
MDNYSNVQQGAYYSAGLRNYLVKVYNYMAMALGLTGIVAFFVASSPAVISMVYNTPLHWVIVFAPMGLVFLMSYKLNVLSFQAILMIFFSFAALVGVSISYVFLVYTAASIAKVFFISSSMFGVMAWYGNVTKKDLSQFGTFLFMGVIGIAIASLVNLFLGSGPLHFALSVVAVVVFTGMTAYDAQRIKDMYYKFNDGTDSSVNKMAILGATTLYFNYINIFISLLNLQGERK